MMTLIEGIGDEVIQCFGIVLFICLGVLAWWSTNMLDIPLIRTVLIVERRIQEISSTEQNSGSQTSDSVRTQSGNESLCQRGDVSLSTNNETKSDIRPDNVNSDIGPSQSCCTNPVTEASSGGISSPESNPDTTSRRNSSSEAIDQNATSEDAGNIRIRLKYLNDDQKLVEGRLQELLGDFKRRHFSLELDAQKLVRLIFNGQVLGRDEETLASCGLYDNCVVHCLVHAARTAEEGGGGVGGGGRSPLGGGRVNNTPPPDWNLGSLLYVSISLALGLGWLCRYNYSHLFTVPTTTAMAVLTVLMAVAVYGFFWHTNDGGPERQPRVASPPNTTAAN